MLLEGATRALSRYYLVLSQRLVKKPKRLKRAMANPPSARRGTRLVQRLGSSEAFLGIRWTPPRGRRSDLQLERGFVLQVRGNMSGSPSGRKRGLWSPHGRHARVNRLYKPPSAGGGALVVNPAQHRISESRRYNSESERISDQLTTRIRPCRAGKTRACHPAPA